MSFLFWAALGASLGIAGLDFFKEPVKFVVIVAVLSIIHSFGYAPI